MENGDQGIIVLENFSQAYGNGVQQVTVYWQKAIDGQGASDYDHT